METAGFYGKLPSHGDFVSRRVSRSFLATWDDWLQKCLARSQQDLGEQWLDAYLTSPIWRFVLSPGACGDQACLGVLVPSVDRVGRYFPLSIVIVVPDGVSPLGLGVSAQDWYERAEQLLLSVLGDGAPDLETFDGLVKELTLPVTYNEIPSPGVSPIPAEHSWSLPLQDATDIGNATSRLLDLMLTEQYGAHSTWWTDGSDILPPVMLTTASLPLPARYTVMLVGDRMPDETEHIETAVDDSAAMALKSLEDLINAPVPVKYVSAGKTDKGKVRSVNEDALLENCGDGLWLVADGMGGHADGKTASGAIVKALTGLELPHTIDGKVAVVSRALQTVNRELRNHALRHPKSSGLGSTVAVLLAAGSSCAILWAGDTRVYRKRGVEFEQLTTDHSERQELAARGDIASILSASNIVTRAVGGEETLHVSTVYATVQSGDRFLLCSDGVHQEVLSNDLYALLDQSDRRKACDDIIASVNGGRAPDNATVLIVDANAA
jgi:type VI secretion system protein ImpM